MASGLKLTPNQTTIYTHLLGRYWVCGTVWLHHIKDDRKRCCELNDKLRLKKLAVIGKPCDGRCGHKHRGRLFMRKLVKTDSKEYREWVKSKSTV